MSLSHFHPLVQQWFTSELGEPTAAQRRGWDSIRSGRHTLIAAPTGSGKTLAAFLTALDDLFREGLDAAAARRGPRPLRVAAQGAERRHSQEPGRTAARHPAARRGRRSRRTPRSPRRSGPATPPQSERAAMLRTPPHILVTTPESLYLLLTSERSREMLRTVRTVIVDEIHAVIGTRRGAHLALSLERLRQLCGRPLLRLGLSATQKPLDEVATFLVGSDGRERVHDRGRGASPGHGSRHRDSALDARRGDVARGLGGVLRSARSADRVASHHAGVRQHAADGGAAGPAPQRSAGRGRRHGASRQPVEGEAARRGDAAQVRAAQGAGRDRVARARASTSATSIWSARSDRRIASRRCCSGSADRDTRCRARRRAGCSR